MAVNLVAGSSAKIDFGDIADLAGLGTMTVALTLKPTAAPSTGKRVFGQWGGGSPKLSWLIFITDTDEIEFITTNGAGAFYGKKTSTLNLASGTQYRIVITHDANGAGTTHLYINGTDYSLTNDGTGNTALANATSTVALGFESDSSSQGQTADYSEVAIWSRVLAAAEVTGYTEGYAAEFFRTGGLHYWPLTDTSHLTDQWGSAHGTNSSGTNATHPTVIQPGGASLVDLAQFGLQVDATAAAIRASQVYVEFLVGETFTAPPSALMRKTLTGIGTRTGARRLHWR